MADPLPVTLPRSDEPRADQDHKAKARPISLARMSGRRQTLENLEYLGRTRSLRIDMSRILAAFAGCAALLSMLGVLAAQPGAPLKPGPQAQPPQPPAPIPPASVPNDGLRWAIRGCPVEMRCSHRVLADALLEFEREAFPKPSGDSPWVDSDLGANAIARARQSSAPGARSMNKPSDLRKDLVWMDKLRMPDLPVRWDRRVIAFLEFYKNDPRGRRIMTSWLRRQNRYRKMILAHLAKAKLPADLLYVAMIESSYDPTEYSRVGASGLWQLMPSGAKIFGLHRDRWLDERNDPVKSTEAAMLYFADLYERFGNWDLAIAAYNAGYGAVLNGMSKYNTNDFWQLLEYENALPWESGVYVPKALATAIVGNNRAAFGFENVTSDAEIRWANVSVPTSVSLAVIARAAGTEKKVIERLNPQLRSGRTPPGRKNYVVRVPRGSEKLFASRFGQLRGDWAKHTTYVVRHGQRFEDIATEFGISRAALRELNGLKTEAEVRGGSTLVVPRRTTAERATNAKPARDDLYASGVPKGKPGNKLLVALPNPAFVLKGKKRRFYRVVAGDSLWRIADAFGVTVVELSAWNGLNASAKLHPRMVLVTWVDKKFSPASKKIAILDEARLELVKAGSTKHIVSAEKRMGRKRLMLTAKAGDTLEKLGKRYGLTARDLARINRIAFNAKLAVGQKIIVYKVVDASLSPRAAKQARAARTGKPARKKKRRKR